MTRGLKAPPTPEHIHHHHHGHAPTDDPEYERLMLLRPHPEVLHRLEDIHGAVLLVKNQPRRSGGGALTSGVTTAGTALKLPSSGCSTLSASSSALPAPARNAL
jgi:hypothetical protein